MTIIMPIKILQLSHKNCQLTHPVHQTEGDVIMFTKQEYNSINYKVSGIHVSIYF